MVHWSTPLNFEIIRWRWFSLSFSVPKIILTRWLRSSDELFNTRWVKRRPDGCARRNPLRRWFDSDLFNNGVFWRTTTAINIVKRVKWSNKHKNLIDLTLADKMKVITCTNVSPFQLNLELYGISSSYEVWKTWPIKGNRFYNYFIDSRESRNTSHCSYSEVGNGIRFLI